MTKLLLVRHATTSWHGQSRVLGQNDVPLDEKGLNQARDLALALEPIAIARILSSPLMRATQTAKALSIQANVGVTIDARLTDMRVGEWEGMTYSDLAERPDFQHFLQNPLTGTIPGGETILQACDRTLLAVSDAVQSFQAGEVVAIVTHSDIVRLLICHYLGASLALYTRFTVAPASVSIVSIAGAAAKVVGINWRPSLREYLIDGTIDRMGSAV